MRKFYKAQEGALRAFMSLPETVGVQQIFLTDREGGHWVWPTRQAPQ